MEEAAVKEMEEYVERLRGCPASAPSADEDGYENGMRVPVSVLNDCNDSFISADEKRQKCSQQLFADTGTMGLLCRHDRPLWAVNMTSAGEKQHYALALIKRFFEHLPRTWRVGILYDIGCQLHRSFEKWGFLPDFKDRISFGISVFHAYGHQWPCQIIYHPRKCIGFGLSDGEGCERFWSFLKKLIPGLRVSGVRPLSYCLHCRRVSNNAYWMQYHQRLFTLDNQVQFLDAKSYENFGVWLFRRWYHLKDKKQEATAKLTDIDIELPTLRAEWASQVQEQTKPIPRTSVHCDLVTTVAERIL